MVYDEYNEDIRKTYKLMMDGDNAGLSENDFYKYYLNVLESSEIYCKYSNLRLVKSIDEKWVIAVEKALPALRKVIQHPRKFIGEEREVVNIAMARNITTESIRYLLQHSNMIDEYREDGTVIPNKILNVYKEESMNTYENRFICTLMAELQMFVNKRYDAIFEASKDEFGTKFNVETTIDNYTEVVDYKLQVTIKDKQNDVDNELENMDIVDRIRNIHKQVNMLIHTEFINIMRKFPQVRPPIIKTNAIKKNKDYIACFDLWEFIYSYTQVGYQVDLLRQDPNISPEFEKEIYMTLFHDYLMIQNFTKNKDALDINRKNRKKKITIGKIRSMLEEIVDGMDIRDNDLKNLIDNELIAIQNRKNKELQNALRIRKKIENKGK